MIAADEALVAGLTDRERRRNGLPRGEDVAARERAAARARAALRHVLHPNGLRTSVLGPGWSEDLDAHCVTPPEPDALRAMGWLPLDGVLRRLGHDAEGQWAIVEGGEVLAGLDLHTSRPPDNPLSAILARCRRRGEVRVREVLELRVLQRRGDVPTADEVVRVASRIEEYLGGDELASFRAGGSSTRPPGRLPSRGPRSVARRLRLWRWGIRRGRRRIVVAISGVDGAGKSSLAGSLRESFRRVGLRATVVWTRPGMGLGLLGRLARAGKRLLRQSPEPGVYRVGAGDRPESLRSRRGVLGWLWALAVTTSFVREARRGARTGEVVIFDRHVLDALATLDLVYGGVRLRAHRALVRRFLPKADVSLYLDVSAGSALERKADDLFGESAVRRQLESYERWIPTIPGLIRIDAAAPAREVTGAALRGILARHQGAGR